MYIVWNKQENRPATKEESDIIMKNYISEDDHIELSWSSTIDTINGTVCREIEEVKQHKQFEVRGMAECSDDSAVLPIHDASLVEQSGTAVCGVCGKNPMLYKDMICMECINKCMIKPPLTES